MLNEAEGNVMERYDAGLFTGSALDYPAFSLGTLLQDTTSCIADCVVGAR